MGSLAATATSGRSGGMNDCFPLGTMVIE